MIYFDTEKTAYEQMKTINKWGKTYLTECTNSEYEELLIRKRIWEGDEIIVNPNYEEEQEQKEKERIGNLQITKRVFMLALQQLGISYTQLKELIATNEQAQMEWELCVELQRKNQFLDIMASTMGVSPKMLDYIFQKANGEDVEIPIESEGNNDD